MKKLLLITGLLLLTGCSTVNRIDPKEGLKCIKGHDELDVSWGSSDGTTYVCDEYSSDKSQITIPWDTRTLTGGEKLSVLWDEAGKEPILLDCVWKPTAINYAEDARCSLAQ